MYIITEYQLQQLMNSYVKMNRDDVFNEIKRQPVNPDGDYAVLGDVLTEFMEKADEYIESHNEENIKRIFLEVLGNKYFT